jgi:hypothetical protein
VLLHAGAVLGVHHLRILDPETPPPPEPDPVELVFAPLPPPPEEPTRFTELPEDRAEEPPEAPDLLSNVDSRARDEEAGGEENALPRMDGETDYAQIGMQEGEPEPSAASDESPLADAAEAPESAEAETETDPTPPTEPEPTVAGAGELKPTEQDPIDTPETPPRQYALGRTAPAPESTPTQMGDIYQPQLESPAGNTTLDGNISLNTTAWDYAPWLKKFRRQFLRNWSAPYGYRLGWIHGWTMVEVHIAPDGTMVHLEKLGEEGHKALHTASMYAFEAAAPYPSLPDDFPEDRLILQIRLQYPQAGRRRR